ncbi:MAG: nodulation protein NfeD [Candidatus Binatia bacterium]
MHHWPPLALALITLLCTAAPALARTPAAGAAHAPGEVLLLTVDGIINPATVTYIRDAIARADESGAAAVLIQLDTPGGLLESAKIIVKELLGAPVPVIVYVAPRGAGATSAGVFVTLAAHVAAMAPGTNIGAAHPVGQQGENIKGDLGEKIENFAASLSRSIAAQRGRNVDWAEKAVRKSVSITETEAVKLKVVDFVAGSVEEVLAKASGRVVDVDGQKVTLALQGASVVPVDMRLSERFLDFLAHPQVAYILLMLGLLGLYVEFSNPGVIFPGVAGAICLVLGLAAMQMLSANWAGVVLIILGLAMLISEVFLPSGVLAIGGIAAFVIGSLLLFDAREPVLRLDRGLIVGAAATLGIFSLTVGWLVVRSQRRKPAVGAEGMIGEVGQVRRLLGPDRRVKVFVHGEYWDAEAEDEVEVGQPVQVVAVDGLRMRVRRAATP